MASRMFTFSRTFKRCSRLPIVHSSSNSRNILQTKTHICSKRIRAAGVVTLSEINSSADERCLKVAWNNGEKSRFPYLFLRENCKCTDCFESSSRQRKVDVLKDDHKDNIMARDIVLTENGQELKCVWPNGHESVFTANWLHERRMFENEEVKKNEKELVQPVDDIVHNDLVVWDRNQLQDKIPRFDYDTLMNDDKTLFDALYNLYQHGLLLLDKGPCRTGVWEELARRIGYLRTTHYGPYFDVKSKANPSNIAYTTEFIPFHVDLLYLSRAPDIQMLHCIHQAPEGKGGENLFVDAFKVAVDLMKINYDHFESLTRINVPFTDFGTDYFGEFALGYSRPILELNRHDRLNAVNFNNFTRADFFQDTHPDDVLKFYTAFNELAKMLYDDKYVISHRLDEGQLVIFHNTRVLHSRTAIAPGATRLLQGNYFEWDIIFSKLRVLHEKLSLTTPHLYKATDDFF